MSYFAKKCSNCKNYEGNIRICESCAHYDHPITVFERITASPEVLAKSSVYCLSSDLCRSDEGKFTVKSNWKSPFIDRCYGTKSEAIAATLERLKGAEK